ncbi:MAG TPA: Hsp70 family protein [Thermoanaerobaculia bacterium]|nr:Hsp70 family protein [Thermoanaerobaculia bacterium]
MENASVLSPSPSSSRCRTCGAPAGRFDRFCGTCGAHLASLRWQAPGEEWQVGDGRLPITSETQATLVLDNDGAVPLALILDDSGPEPMPRWLDLSALRNETFRLAPGEGPLTLPLPLIGAEDLLRADSGLHEALLSFLTSGSDQPLHLTVTFAPDPWVKPLASRYRFLPLERLRQGLRHEVEIHNAAAAPLRLERISFQEGPGAPPAGYAQLPPAALLRAAEEVQTPVEIAAGTVWKHTLLLQADEVSLPGDSPAWFSASVRYELALHNETRYVTTWLSGVVGRGPSLEVRGAATFSPQAPDRDTQGVFTLYNPGHLPVEVQGIEVVRERHGREEPPPPSDWLVLKGLVPGEVLEPGAERTLTVGYLPEDRPLDELKDDVSTRAIRIRHDGWQPEPADRVAVCRVHAPFGPTESRTLGIDFGTSNSVACLMGEREAHPLALEILGDGSHRDHLASLMYFQERPADASDPEPFLYGEEARSSANNQPSNLVRSIKTVVGDGAERDYRFLAKGAEGGEVRFKPQDLLNRFIRQVRLRAERGVPMLAAGVRQREHLLGGQPLFRDAVFSHPVEMTDSMKLALMQAAHRAGINTRIQSPEEFFLECCVDEATAAVLAYVYRLLDDAEDEAGGKLKDLERILCVDIGGGTTDIAAVTVRDIAAYAAGVAEKVTVDLWNNRGDRRFAGDVLDRLLALEILRDIEDRSRKTGSPILMEEVVDALLSPSYSVYKHSFLARAKAGPRRRETEESLDPHTVYGLAATVLQAAEEAKRAFSSEGQVTKTVTGVGWPRASRGTAALTDNFEVVVQRETFEAIAKRELKERFHLIDRVVAGTDWTWPTITTLLLTGQSMRSPLLRQPVVEYVRTQMGEEAARGLTVVAPEDNARPGEVFDPKTCVAMGAALWGISRTRDDAWLAINRPYLERLTFDLTTRGGPRRFKKIQGLVSGASLPAEGKLEFPVARESLSLFRDREEFIRFRNFRPASRMTIRVESLAEYWLVIDDERFPGEIMK